MNCFYEEMEKHVKKHLKYPEEARNKKIENKVSVHFEIDKNGRVTNIQARGKQTEFKSLFEEEAKRIISLLPDFIPATQRKKPVVVKYAIPIIFTL